MEAKPQLEQSSTEDQIRTALNSHWQASAAGDANAEHDIYDDKVICDYPQSGERIPGRSNLQALRTHHPGKPTGFQVKRILGNGELWITEYSITYQERVAYTVSIMESAMARLSMKHCISRIPSKSRLGASSGFSRVGDAAFTHQGKHTNPSASLKTMVNVYFVAYSMTNRNLIIRCQKFDLAARAFSRISETSL